MSSIGQWKCEYLVGLIKRKDQLSFLKLYLTEYNKIFLLNSCKIKPMDRIKFILNELKVILKTLFNP